MNRLGNVFVALCAVAPVVAVVVAGLVAGFHITIAGNTREVILGVMGVMFMAPVGALFVMVAWAVVSGVWKEIREYPFWVIPAIAVFVLACKGVINVPTAILIAAFIVACAIYDTWGQR